MTVIFSKKSFKSRCCRLGDTETRGNESNEMGDMLPKTDLGSGFDAIGMSLGDYHSCFLSKIGEIKCCGDNERGQLGTEGDDTIDTTVATDVVNLGSDFIAASMTISSPGAYHTCAENANAIDWDSQWKCWGYVCDITLLNSLSTQHYRTQPSWCINIFIKNPKSTVRFNFVLIPIRIECS